MTDNDQQLEIWKNLAVSKQMIMNEAAASLKLPSEWSQEELKVALDDAIAKGASAAQDIEKARAEATSAINEMTEKLNIAEKARAKADAEAAELSSAKEQAESQLANGRKDNAEALKKAKQQVAEKDKELKAINTALADTPDNVVKKLKNLKKQKHEENLARTRSEEQNRKLKKDIKSLEEQREQQDDYAAKGASLAAQYRELLAASEKQQELLKKENIESPDLPSTDYSLLDIFESADAEADAEHVEEKEAAHA